MSRDRSSRAIRGFTLIEILIVVSVLAILGAIAVVGYQKYIERARGTDLIERFDAIRSGLSAQIAQGTADNCDALAQSLGQSGLVDEYATLGYGFEPVAGGFRPVMTVCAKVDQHGPRGVGATRGALETLTRNGVVEQNPVMTDSVVSFALRLTAGDAALCKKYAGPSTTACGEPLYPGPASCPAGQVRLLGEDQNYRKNWGCYEACPSGQARKPGMLNCEPL